MLRRFFRKCAEDWEDDPPLFCFTCFVCVCLVGMLGLIVWGLTVAFMAAPILTGLISLGVLILLAIPIVLVQIGKRI